MKFLGTMHGGYLKEHKGPVPFVRLFDDKRRRRRVTIQIYSWVGLCPGATHYHVTMREEDNPVLGFKEFGGKEEWRWIVYWDDIEAEGQVECSSGLPDEAHVWSWIKRTWKEMFSSKTHRVEFMYREYQKKFRKATARLINKWETEHDCQFQV
jgi:hypothetical protein